MHYAIMNHDKHKVRDEAFLEQQVSFIDFSWQNFSASLWQMFFMIPSHRKRMH
jgi:hypothetical protein